MLVANGEKILGSGICRGVELKCQGVSVSLDLLLLDMGGNQLVLGAQWLRQLDDIVMNFKTLQMPFFHHGKERIWQDLLASESKIVDEKTLCKELRAQGQGFLLHLHCMMAEVPSNFHSLTSCQIAALNVILNEYDGVFKNPTVLPPPRLCDHAIPLITDAKPVCIRPYRHVHFLKDEIESQVNAMLTATVIRPSQSPYASPVVMVKKSDGG